MDWVKFALTVGGILFGAGVTWGLIRGKIGELERRVVAVEGTLGNYATKEICEIVHKNLSREVLEMKKDVKRISRFVDWYLGHKEGLDEKQADKIVNGDT